jgi:hypothetical protein
MPHAVALLMAKAEKGLAAVFISLSLDGRRLVVIAVKLCLLSILNALYQTIFVILYSDF